MFYKSSILTATFVLLSILIPRAYANAAESPTSKDSSSERQPESLAAPLPLSIADAAVASDTGSLNVEADLTKDLKMSYVSPLTDTLPIERKSIAQTPKSTLKNSSEPKKWAVGVHAQASTTGFIGVDAGYKFTPNLHARLGLNTVGFNLDYKSEEIDYKGSFKPTNIHLLGDYFPFGGGLRLTSGLVFQSNRFTTTGQSGSNAQVTLNGTTYTAEQVGTLGSEGSFSNGVAPYLGIGFGTPIGSGFGFNMDAGVMFAGSPTVKLSATPNPLIPGLIQDQIRTDLAVQEQKTNDDIKNFGVYPVISIGVSYAF